MFSILLAAIIVAANATPTAPLAAALSPPVVVTSALGMTKGQTLAEALAEPFPNTFTVINAPAKSPAARTVHDCTGYLALGRRFLEMGSTLDDEALLWTGVRCVALDWIAGVTPTRHAPIPRFSLRGLRLRQLPPQLALIISPDEQAAARQASLRGESILAIEPDVTLRAMTVTKASLTSADWTEDLTLYAYGDFQGGGSQQILIRTDADVIGGTYKASHLYLLTRKGTSWVIVRSYPDVP